MWGADHLGPISTKIDRVEGVHDVIILSNFVFNIFRSFRSIGVKISIFPLTLLVIVTTLMPLPRSLWSRKPSWSKGKRATAVRVWRPLAKKSSANQRYAITYWWLIVTVAALLTVCEIFSGLEVENRHFRPLYCDWRPLAEERRATSM